MENTLDRHAILIALISLLTSMIASSSFAQQSELKVAPTYRVTRLFYGCWNVKRPPVKGSPWPASQTTRCFHHGRAIYGSTMDAGDGWDFCERWRVTGERLALRDNYGHAQQCLYAFSEDGQTLILRDCPSAGDWQRISDLSRGQPTCRIQDSLEATDDTNTEP